MTESVIDPETLDNLISMTDQAFLAELIDAYVEESPGLLQEMKNSLAQGDAEGFRRAAHSLKSSSASLGALNFSEFASQMEALGRAQDLEAAEAKMDQFKSEYLKVEASLEAIKNES